MGGYPRPKADILPTANQTPDSRRGHLDGLGPKARAFGEKREKSVRHLLRRTGQLDGAMKFDEAHPCCASPC